MPDQRNRRCFRLDAVAHARLRAWAAGAAGLLGSLSFSCGSNERPPAAGSSAITAGSGGVTAAGAAGAGGAAQAGSSGAAGSLAGGAAGSAGDGSGGSDTFPSCVPRPACRNLCQTLGSDPTACGFGNTQQCGCICEERFGGPCPDELEALRECTGETPSLDCSERGRVFEGCEDESIALEFCDGNARERLCARAFPACTPYCVSLTLSFCPEGPESASSCLCGCEATLASTCEEEFAAFMSCTNEAPAFECDSAGAPQASSCTSEWQALDRCSRGLDPLAPDAG